jgi:hypothetical protein
VLSTIIAEAPYLSDGDLECRLAVLAGERASKAGSQR